MMLRNFKNSIPHLHQLIDGYKQNWFVVSLNILMVVFFLMSVLFAGGRIYALFAKNPKLQTYTLAPARNIAIKTESLSTWHLFGKQQGVKEGANSNWKLSGIILSNNSLNNSAIISSPNSKETIYKQGDKLEDGSIVSRIESNRVLLLRNGVTETLNIPWGDVSSSQAPQILGKPFSIMKEP